MPGDLATMKARIASEIARDDLDDKIANAISDAISAYTNSRFRFSESIPSAPQTFNTAVGRETYTSADNANISTAIGIDYLNIAIGNTLQKLMRVQPEEAHLYNQQNTMMGQPSWWAYEGNQIILSPIPSSIWTVTMGLFRNVAAPASDTEADNPWMTVAERLIRSRAKFELAVHITRNDKMAAAMSPYPGMGGGIDGASYREYIDLKSETNRITGRGIIRPMAF